MNLKQYLNESQIKLNISNLNDLLVVIKKNALTVIRKYDMEYLTTANTKQKWDAVSGVVSAESNEVLEKAQKNLQDILDKNENKITQEILKEIKM